jgi:hypothetical protein
MRKIYVGLLLALSSHTALALEVIVGHGVALEPTYMPGYISFEMDAGSASCPTGRWLLWKNPDTANNKAVYATLMQAMATGKKIRFHINDGDANCQGQYIHLLSDV